MPDPSGTCPQAALRCPAANLSTQLEHTVHLALTSPDSKEIHRFDLLGQGSTCGAAQRPLRNATRKINAPPHCDVAPASEFTKKGVDLRTQKTASRGHRKA